VTQVEKLVVAPRSPARAGLSSLWNLNFKAMPTALLWSVTLLVGLETNSLLVRILAVASCSVASILSSHLIRREVRPSAKYSLAETLRDPTIVGLLSITGLIYALSLENVSRYATSTPLVRFFFVANFITALILWFFVQIVILPIRMIGESKFLVSTDLRSALVYIKRNKSALAISFLPLLVGWVLFFFYFLLALTFAQAVTYGTFEADMWTQIGD
jgi:hypothetical protein